jgi:hypothetical protein
LFVVVSLVFSWSRVQQEVRAQDAPQTPAPVVGGAVGFGESAPVRELAARAVARPAPDAPQSRVYTVPNRQLPNALNQDYTFPSIPDGALSRVVAPYVMPGPILTAEGLSGNDNATFGAGFIAPPDTVGDVGPDHYVQMTNRLVRVFNKAGVALQAPVRLSSIVASAGIGGPCAARDDGDPIVLYDPLADRWLLSQFCLPSYPGPPFHQIVAVSKTGDPAGQYFVYDFLCPGNKLNDYPKFGVWPDAYYMTVNQFINGTTFSGTGAYAFDRRKIVAGDPSATFIYFDVASLQGTLPADLDGITPPPIATPNYIARFTADEFGGTDAIQIHEFSAIFQNPAASTFSLQATIAVAAFDPRSPGGLAHIEQPGAPASASLLDSMQDRLMHRLQYRNAGGHESLVVTHTVNVSGGNGSTPALHQSGIRYYEFRRALPGGAWFVNEQGTFAPDAGNGATGTNRWMGSAAMDRSGNLAVGYSASSTTTMPQIRWAGRLAGDPAGSLAQGEAVVFSGTGVQGTGLSRWGDYSSMNVDPADDCTFWYANQYHTAADQSPDGMRWHTRFGQFEFPSCVAQAPGTFTGTVLNGVTGAAVKGAYILANGVFHGATDENGAFTIKAGPGTYTVSATMPNFTTDQETAAVGAGATTAVPALRISPKETDFGTHPAVPGTLGPIPDGPSETPGTWGAPRNVQFTVTGVTRPIARVEVAFTMSPPHTFVGDLEVMLIAPGGVRSHLIFSRTGFYDPATSANGDSSAVGGPYTFTDATLQDWWIAAAETGPGTIPSGRYRTSAAGPSGVVTSMNLTFAGLQPAEANGTWTLRFRDGTHLDTGSVASATLAFTQLRKTPLLDFDADIKSDFSIIRVQNPLIWYVQNDTGFSATAFGRCGLAPKPAGCPTADFITPSDYDGDNRTDIGVWRPGAQGVFYHLRSSDGLLESFPFGTTLDYPGIVADYDGDGRTDRAVARDVSGARVWYMMRSALGFGAVQFGSSTTDFLTPGDWDGDGKTDQAVRRRDTSTYYVNGSAAGFFAFPWGLPTDTNANNDYDGDGKTDATVIRSVGDLMIWYIRRSSDLGLSVYQFGYWPTDYLAPADYDGDGKTDVAIWRGRGPATPGSVGFWVLRSSDGAASFFPFGQLGDVPVAQALVR